MKSVFKKRALLQPKKTIKKMVSCDLHERVSYREFRDAVRRKYDGPQGAVLTAASYFSLHLPLGTRLFKGRKFDLRNARHILDVGSGSGQMLKPLMKYADPEAKITCFDLSFEMMRRARNRIKHNFPFHTVADLSHLPFADNTFDRVTCGYVLEHLPDARPGLLELFRVMSPGGRFLLLVTEDSVSGAFTSRIWRCRTYTRPELRKIVEEVGFIWNQDLWFTPLHRVFKAGGICVELVKPQA